MACDLSSNKREKEGRKRDKNVVWGDIPAFDRERWDSGKFKVILGFLGNLRPAGAS